MKKHLLLIPVLLLVLLLPACTASNQPNPDASAEPAATIAPPSDPSQPMSVTSTGIIDGVLGEEYGMRGGQKKLFVPSLSPPLSIANAPEGTVSFALTMLDPDAEAVSGFVWVHWLAANITSSEIPANASLDAEDQENGMVQGRNSYNTDIYGGPTPPDQPHTYVFTVYALDTKLDLEAGFSQRQLKQAMEGHILAEATITGSYSN